jgi:hypothetical protein
MKSYIKRKPGGIGRTVREINEKLRVGFQEKHATSGIIVPAHDIMYGMIYPAVLGTGLVLAVLRATKEDSAYSRFHDSALYVAFAAGLFYLFSFTSGSEKKEDKTDIAYRWPTFLVDFLEVILMFLCFYFLGLLDDHAVDPRLSPAYAFLLIDVVFIQPLWRLVAGVEVLYYFWFRATVAMSLIAGIIFGLRSGILHPWVDLLLCLVVSCCVFLYIKGTREFHCE